MTSQILERIRGCIRNGKYDLTSHAFDEMADDELTLLNVEQSILSDKITKIATGDPRGTKYTVHGTGSSPFVQVGSVGRFVPDEGYLLSLFMLSATMENKMYNYLCEYCDGTVRPKRVNREVFKHRDGFVILMDLY